MSSRFFTHLPIGERRPKYTTLREGHTFFFFVNLLRRSAFYGHVPGTNKYKENVVSGLYVLNLNHVLSENVYISSVN